MSLSTNERVCVGAGGPAESLMSMARGRCSLVSGRAKQLARAKCLFELRCLCNFQISLNVELQSLQKCFGRGGSMMTEKESGVKMSFQNDKNAVGLCMVVKIVRHGGRLW